MKVKLIQPKHNRPNFNVCFKMTQYRNVPPKTCWIRGCQFLFPVRNDVMNVGFTGVKKIYFTTRETPPNCICWKFRHPRKQTCPLKQGHFKRKVVFPVFQPLCFMGHSFVFGGVVPIEATSLNKVDPKQLLFRTSLLEPSPPQPNCPLLQFFRQESLFPQPMSKIRSLRFYSLWNQALAMLVDGLMLWLRLAQGAEKKMPPKQ